jgi:hypothetical protein
MATSGEKKRSRDSDASDAPAPKAARVVTGVTRLYAALSCYGEQADYTLYIQPDKERSARVHAAIKALADESEKDGVPLVSHMLGWLGKHWSVAEVEQHIAATKPTGNMPGFSGSGDVESMRKALVHFKAIGDEGREDDSFKGIGDEGRVCYENEMNPVVSVMSYYWNM